MTISISFSIEPAGSFEVVRATTTISHFLSCLACWLVWGSCVSVLLPQTSRAPFLQRFHRLGHDFELGVVFRGFHGLGHEFESGIDSMRFHGLGSDFESDTVSVGFHRLGCDFELCIVLKGFRRLGHSSEFCIAFE